MKKIQKNIIKFASLALLIGCVSTVGVGYAKWQFSEGKSATAETKTASIGTFKFEWTNSDKLSSTMYSMVEDFIYAVNNTDSTEGKALTTAWSQNSSDSISSWNHDYVGTMADTSSSNTTIEENLRTVFANTTAGSDYVIFIKKITTSNQSAQCNGKTQSTTTHVGYDLYFYDGTIDNSTSSSTVSVIYKTCIETTSDNKYSPIASYSGYSTSCTYGNGFGNASFDSGKYTIYSTWNDGSSTT
jgi:hypothetical protein